ncbi:MAG: HDOD domain-containing protein [Bradymonadia bacterium]|jgi:HD-like signal output (HDOD) protein
MVLFRRAEVEPTTEDQLIDDIGRRMLKRRVDALKSLPTFPDSVLRLNKLLSEDGAKESLQKIASAIETDPVLCARILRLVNSAFYGVSGAIITVFDALLMLGLDVVKGLIVSTTVSDMFSGRGSALDGLWEHSYGCAIAAGALGRTLGMPRCEELSAAALMHDIGKMVLASQLTDEYRAVVAQAVADRRSIRETEAKLLGVTHDEIGHWLVLRWKLPTAIAEPIARHHEPMKAGKYADTAAVVHVADLMIRGYGFGFAGDRIMPRLDDGAWKHLSLNADKLRTAVKRMQVDLHAAMNQVNTMPTV